MQRSLLQSNVNGFISLVFVGSFALAAGLIMWQATFGENPIADAMVAHVLTDKNY